MFFSIITICLNDEKRIKKTLKSVYSQTCIDYEHIIIDGESCDRTLKVVENMRVKYPKPTNLIVYSEKDKGVYDAMNKGIDRAKGEYICFMNSGDIFWDEAVLQSVHESILNMQGYDLYYGDAIAVESNGEQAFQFRRFICKNEEEFKKQITSGLYGPCHQAQFANKRCFKNNLFDLHYPLRAEAKWFIKMYIQGGKIHYLPQIICKYEMGGYSHRCSSIEQSDREIEKIKREFGLCQYEKEKKTYFSSINENIYRKWLALKIAEKTLADFLIKMNYKNVAVYGYGVMGNYFINDLKNTEVIVDYVIDRDDKYSYNGQKIYKPTDSLPKTSAIVVTVIGEYERIKEKLKSKINVPILSLEDILDNAW